MAQCPARAVHWCSWSWCLHQWKFRSWFALFGSRRLLDDEKNTKWTRWIVCLRNSFALRLIEIILGLRLCRISRSLSTRILETRTATGRDHFSCQDRIVSQIFILIISNGVRILSNVNVVVWGHVNSSLPVAVRVSKTCVLKLPRTENFVWLRWPTTCRCG